MCWLPFSLLSLSLGLIVGPVLTKRCMKITPYTQGVRYTMRLFISIKFNLPIIQPLSPLCTGKDNLHWLDIALRQESNLHPFATKNSIIRNLMSKFLTSVCTYNPPTTPPNPQTYKDILLIKFLMMLKSVRI